MTPSQKIVHDAHDGIHEFRHAPQAGDVAFPDSYERDACPRCGAPAPVKYGFGPDGLRKWRCRGCRKVFTPATGTIFENRKLPLPAWVDFLLQTLSFESIASMTREDRRAGTTTPYWVAKLFAVLDGVQGATVLSGRVEIDETYYPVPGTEEAGVDGKRLRGLSRNKICIGIGCDGEGRSVFFDEGRGKTSGKRTWGAFGSHIEPGSELVHDKEKGHNMLVRELGLEDRRYDSKAISRLPDELNPLARVNRLCFLAKLFLNSHSGFDRADMQNWLNVLSVAMNPPAEKMEKAAMVLDLAMSNPKTLRFREFYEKKPS